MRTIDKDLKKALKAAGCTLEWTRSNHVRIIYKGRVASVTSSTPSDRRSTLNLYSQLRRNGVPI